MIQKHIAKVDNKKVPTQSKVQKQEAPAVFSSSIARMKIDKMKDLMHEVEKRTNSQMNQMYGI